MINKNKIIFGGVGFLISLAFVFYLGSFVVPKVLVTLTKATGVSKVSLSKSFVLGEKIMAKADGVDKCVVNVFVLDADGMGIAGKQVQLSGLESQVSVTDNTGKATFELTSTMAKQYELAASIGGASLGKTMKVTFRN